MSRFSVAVSGDSVSELVVNFTTFLDMMRASTAYSATPEPKRGRGRPAKAKPKPETIEGTAEVVSDVSTDPSDGVEASAGEQTADVAASTADAEAVEDADALRVELKAVLTELHAAKGLNYVVRVLQQYNADRVSSVKPELLAKAIAEAKQYLAAQ